MGGDPLARGDPVGDDLGAERSRSGAAASAVHAAVEDQADLVRAAGVEVVPDDLLEEDPPGHGSVEDLGQGELSLQDREFVSVAGGAVRGGERVWQPSEPLAQQRVDLLGPGWSQSACNAAGSSQVANPLSSAVWPIPALVAWRLAHSWPLMHSRAL